MSRHEFRLRSVLQARKRELDTARGQLADELREKNRELREQQSHLMHLRDTSRNLHDRMTLGTSAATLPAVDGAMEAAHAGAIAAGERVDARKESIDSAIVRITDARKRLRSLEILEARWHERKRRERSKHDQKRLDEIATRPRRGLSS